MITLILSCARRFGSPQSESYSGVCHRNNCHGKEILNRQETSAVILEHGQVGLSCIGPKVNVAKRLLSFDFLAIFIDAQIFNIAESVHKSHGKCEEQAQNPNEEYDHFGKQLRRFAAERIHNGAIPVSKQSIDNKKLKIRYS